jgi:hypothetical protein
MTTLGKGFRVTSDGKVKRSAPKKDASQIIRERKSKKSRPVSPKAARTLNSMGKAR